MANKKTTDAVSKLTQAQKSYLVRRIDQVARQKISDIRSGYHSLRDGIVSRGESTIDMVVAEGLSKGAIKLKTQKDFIVTFKSKIKSWTTGSGNYFSLNAIDFVDRASLAAFNRSINDALKKQSKAFKERTGAINAEADGLKDKVMLEGSLAIELLTNFEKKKF